MLQVFNTDGLELVINTDTGEAYATQAGYCRMSGASKSTISMRMKGVQELIRTESKIYTPGGLQEVHLIPASLVFKWLLKDNSELAERMGECGATVFLHQLAGYTVKVEDKIQPSSDKLISLFEQMNDRLQTLESRTLKLDIVEEENKVLSTELLDTKKVLEIIDNAGLKHQGCKNIIDKEIVLPKQPMFTSYEFLELNSYDVGFESVLSRRTAALYCTSKKEEPPRNWKGNLLFEQSYLEEVYESLKK